MADDENILKEAISIFKSGNLDESILLLEEATKKYPSSYDAFVYLGVAYSQQKRYNAAIGAFKHASTLKPNSAKIHYNLGQAYEAAGVPREAWYEYKNALGIDPNYTYAKQAMSSLSGKLPKLLSSGIEFESDK